MTHVVTESCIKCKYTSCVPVCPVDCFYEGPNFLVINPIECIDCGVCIAECPIDAIVPEHVLPKEEFKKWEKLNAELSKIWPKITENKLPLPDADEWADKLDKLQFLQKE